MATAPARVRIAHANLLFSSCLVEYLRVTVNDVRALDLNGLAAIERECVYVISSQLAPTFSLPLLHAIPACESCAIILFPDNKDSFQEARHFTLPGVRGFVSEGVPLDEFTDAIQAAAHNKFFAWPAAIAYTVFNSSHLPSSEECTLTPQQRNVLCLIGRGLSNKQIAGQLHVSLFTVKNHVHNILARLGASSREEAVGMVRPWEIKGSCCN